MSETTVNESNAVSLKGGSDPVTVLRYPFHMLTLSPTNPRKSSNPEKDKELAESIKQSFANGGPGVLEPLLCRPVGEKFEVVAGSRRFRAAQKAGLDDVPCLVREMTDQEALEIQIVENLQRADVAPIDEARGFKTLAETTKVSEIAKRVGKSPSYIYASISLCDLIPAAQKDMEAGILPPAHAFRVARLPEAAQKRCLETLLPDWLRKDTEAQRGPNLSVRGLDDFIKRNIGTNLKKAPFSVKDPDLVKKAGACTTCPKL